MSQEEEVDVVRVSNNAIYLTKEIREAFDIKDGDKLFVSRKDDGRMVIKKVARKLKALGSSESSGSRNESPSVLYRIAG